MDQTKKKPRIPQQARSQETKSKLLEAGTTLILQKGIHATSSNEIAKEAGVAIGSFYAYFKDKRALLLELLNNSKDRMFRSVELDQAFVEGLQSNPRETFVRIINTLVSGHKESRELYDQLLSMAVHDSDMKQMLDEWHQQSFTRTHEFMTLFREKIRVRNFEAALRVVHTTLMENVHLIDKQPAGISEDALINEVADLLYRYLFLSE